MSGRGDAGLEMSGRGDAGLEVVCPPPLQISRFAFLVQL